MLDQALLTLTPFPVQSSQQNCSLSEYDFLFKLSTIALVRMSRILGDTDVVWNFFSRWTVVDYWLATSRVVRVEKVVGFLKFLFQHAIYELRIQKHYWLKSKLRPSERTQRYISPLALPLHIVQRTEGQRDDLPARGPPTSPPLNIWLPGCYEKVLGHQTNQKLFKTGPVQFLHKFQFLPRGKYMLGQQGVVNPFTAILNLICDTLINIIII